MQEDFVFLIQSKKELNSISQGLKKDKHVQIIGFGTILVKTRKARNLQTGEGIKIKASKIVGFKVGKKRKETIWKMIENCFFSSEGQYRFNVEFSDETHVG